MQREPRAYLADILESCDAIAIAISGIQIQDYRCRRLVHSSVERECTIIGEAVLSLSHKAPDIFDSITSARRMSYSDLSLAKLRPVLVLSGVGMGDFVLCKVTSMSWQIDC